MVWKWLMIKEFPKQQLILHPRPVGLSTLFCVTKQFLLRQQLLPSLLFPPPFLQWRWSLRFCPPPYFLALSDLICSWLFHDPFLWILPNWHLSPQLPFSHVQLPTGCPQQGSSRPTKLEWSVLNSNVLLHCTSFPGLSNYHECGLKHQKCNLSQSWRP